MTQVTIVDDPHLIEVLVSNGLESNFITQEKFSEFVSQFLQGKRMFAGKMRSLSLTQNESDAPNH